MRSVGAWLCIATALVACRARPSRTDDVSQLLAAARALVPAYEGRTKDHLSSSELVDVHAAIEILERALASRDESPNVVRRELAHGLVLIANDERWRGEEQGELATLERASTVLLDVLETDPHDVWSLYKLGIVYAARGISNDAAMAFERAIMAASDAVERDLGGAEPSRGALDPSELADLRARAMLERGIALHRAGKREHARSALEALLLESGVDHLRESAHRALAEIALDAGEVDLAREHMKRACGFAVDHTHALRPLLASYLLAASDAERSGLVTALRDLLDHAPWPDDLERWQRTIAAFHVACWDRSHGGDLSRRDEHMQAAARDPESFHASLAAAEHMRNGGTRAIAELRAAAELHIALGLALDVERGVATSRRSAIEACERALAGPERLAPSEHVHARRLLAELRRGDVATPPIGR